jgi:hypothetical protein
MDYYGPPPVNLGAPGPIGGTTPSSGAFTTVSATIGYTGGTFSGASISGSTITGTGLVTGLHFVGNSSTPTLAYGPGAGTSPGAKSITGTDVAGLISFTAGTAPPANSVILTVTFASAFSVAPYIAAGCGNANAATTFGNSTSAPYWVTTTSGFTLNSNSVGIPASVIYVLYYQILG